MSTRAIGLQWQGFILSSSFDFRIGARAFKRHVLRKRLALGRRRRTARLLGLSLCKCLLSNKRSLGIHMLLCNRAAGVTHAVSLSRLIQPLGLPRVNLTAFMELSRAAAARFYRVYSFLATLIAKTAWIAVAGACVGLEAVLEMRGAE